MSSVADSAVSLLAELVSIDSVNPGLAEGAAGEKAIVDFLRERLDRSGFATHIVDSTGTTERPSLVAIAPGEPDWPVVVLNGHLDTVGVSGMPAAFEPRVDGDRMFGRGTADMKGGVAGIVAVAEHLVAEGARVRPVLALVADEEDSSLGSEAVIAALPGLGVTPRVCLIAEPTDLAICRSLRGFAVVDVEFAGVASHSSQPDLGVNAITHLGRLLHEVDQRRADHRATGGDVMVTVAHGGESPFVIPDSARCAVEFRLTADTPSGGVIAEVESMLRPEWNATATVAAHRDGWRLSTSGAAAELAAQLGDALGTGATFDAPYWMEAPLWERSAPTLVCGPSGGGLHSVDEWVDLGQVRAFADALLRVLSA